MIYTVEGNSSDMTSARSYRDRLTREKMKSELREGMGKQFDPGFAAILLRLIESGEDLEVVQAVEKDAAK